MDVARDRVFYFTFAVLGLTLSLGLDVLPGIVSFGTSELSPWLTLPVIVTGVLMLTALLHLARKGCSTTRDVCQKLISLDLPVTNGQPRLTPYDSLVKNPQK